MMRLANLGIFALAGFGVCYCVLEVVIRVWRRHQHSARSADFHHTQNLSELPVPRFGGIALAIAFALLICLPFDALFGGQKDSVRCIAGTALAMFGLGFWDDLHGSAQNTNWADNCSLP